MLRLSMLGAHMAGVMLPLGRWVTGDNTVCWAHETCCLGGLRRVGVIQSLVISFPLFFDAWGLPPGKHYTKAADCQLS